MQDHETHYSMDQEIRELNAKLRFHLMSQRTFDKWARFAQNNGVDFLDMLKVMSEAQEKDDPAILDKCENYCTPSSLCDPELAVAYLILQSEEEAFNKSPRVVAHVIERLQYSSHLVDRYLLSCLTLAAARFPYILDNKYNLAAEVLRVYVDGEEAVKFLGYLHPQVAMQIVTKLDEFHDPEEDFSPSSRLATYAISSKKGVQLINAGVFTNVNLCALPNVPFLGLLSFEEPEVGMPEAYAEVVGFALQISALYMFKNAQEIFAKTRGTKLCFLTNLYDLCERNEEDVEQFYSAFENATDNTAHNVLVNTTLAYCFALMYDHVKKDDVEVAINCCKIASNNALAYSNAIYALCVSDTMQPIELPSDL
jgi:hypothetical protein